MPAPLNAAHPLIRFAFYGNLLLLMLAIHPAEWTHATVMLPWLITLACQDTRANCFQILRMNKQLTLTSVLLTVLILLGCQSHMCTSFGLEAASIPVLWIPIATLFRSIEWKYHRIAIAAVLSAATACISLVVIWQFAGEHEPRPKGLSHNVLTAPMLLAMLCLIGALISQQKKQIPKTIFLTIAIFGISASILTHSKTGLLTFLAATSIHLITRPAERKKTLATTAPLITVWALSLTDMLANVLTDYVGYGNGQYKSSLAERTDAIRWAGIHILDNPLLGKGPIQLTDEFSQRWQEWGRNKNAVLPMLHLHNDYLQMSIAYGVLTSMCFTAMWLIPTFKIIKPQLAPLCGPTLPPIKTWMLMMIGIFMTAFMTDSFTYWGSTWGMVTACVGLLIGIAPPDIQDNISRT